MLERSFSKPVGALQLIEMHKASPQAIAAYQIANRKRYEPVSPLRSEAFYQAKGWKRLQRDYRKGRKQGQNLFLYLVDGQKVIAHIAFSHISGGAFCSCYLGYGIDGEYEGQGLLKKALKVCLKYMFEERGINRVQASHLVDNKRSEGLLKKLGFIPIGIARKYLNIAGEWRDHKMQQLLKEDFK